MRIDGQSPLLGPALLAALAARNDGFAAEGALADPKAASPIPPAATTLNMQPATSVAMLVALAAVERPGEGHRRAIDRARDGLAALDRLRKDLATGVVPPERLRELAEWTAASSVPDDPALAELMQDIELRVRVELAKHDLLA